MKKLTTKSDNEKLFKNKNSTAMGQYFLKMRSNCSQFIVTRRQKTNKGGLPLPTFGPAQMAPLEGLFTLCPSKQAHLTGCRKAAPMAGKSRAKKCTPFGPDFPLGAVPLLPLKWLSVSGQPLLVSECSEGRASGHPWELLPGMVSKQSPKELSFGSCLARLSV